MARKKKRPQSSGADMRRQDDPFGSYTGVVLDDCYDKPIQDADDL